MRKLWTTHKGWGVGLAAFSVLVLALYAYADGPNLGVHSFTFDPFQTKLVGAEWVIGAGCPTGATTNTTGGPPNGTFTDAACATGDPNDRDNKGLVLVKTGPTANIAAAGAFITGIPSSGITLTEIGYDIRRGSHCGAGAPRFNIRTTTGKFYGLGCSQSASDVTTTGTGWSRLKWGNGSAGSVMAFRDFVTLEAITDPVQSISILFDEGQNTDPIGLAVLDNININGTLTGKE